MERKLNYILSEEGVSPSEKLCGGIQGENKATAITVTLDSALSSAVNEKKNGGEEVYCAFDVLSETGEFFEGEKREIANISEPFYLTEEMTASGLDVTVIVKIGYSSSTFYKAQIKLYFEECPTYKTLNLKKKDEIQIFEEKAEELFSLLEQKAGDAERKLDVKCEKAANSATLAAGHLDKVIAFNQSAKENSEAAAESAAAAEAAAESAEKDFETVKELFSSSLQNINNHNFDPTAHADIRGFSQEIVRYVSSVNEIAEKAAEFTESHNTDIQSHKEIRDGVEEVKQSLTKVVGTTYKNAEFANSHNTDATSHPDIREQVALANGRIDLVQEDVNLLEKEVAAAISVVGGVEPLKLIKTITVEDDVTDIDVTLDKGLKEIAVIMHVAFNEAATKGLSCRSNGGKWYMFSTSVGLTTDKRYFYAHAKELHERRWETTMFGATSPNLGGTSTVTPKIAVSNREENISRYPKDFNFFTVGRTSKFVAGSTIEIWGVEE